MIKKEWVQPRVKEINIKMTENGVSNPHPESFFGNPNHPGQLDPPCPPCPCCS